MKRLAIGLLVLVATFGAAGAPAASPDFQISNTVVMTRADGTALPPAQTVRVWCGPWESDVRTPSIHASAGGPSGGWSMSAVLADVRRRPVVRFPHSFVFNKPTGAEIFGGDGRNELSTEGEDSSGRITFTRARCGKRLDIRFKVDAVMDSEFHDAPPVAIRGTFSARG